MATNSITVWATSQTAQLQDEAQYKRDAELGIRRASLTLSRRT